jgi:hypothetical protein
MTKAPQPKGSESPRPQSETRRPGKKKDEALDQTIEDSFPASDPPSSIPDPEVDEDAA